MHSDTEQTSERIDAATGPEADLRDWSSEVERAAESPRTSSSTATSWILIEDARNPESPTRRISQETLMRRYWSAVFAFIRSSGRSEQQAEDLTQGFFCDVVIGRDLLARADDRRGRFRSLLLSSVRNYLADDHRMRTAQRRSPGNARLLSIDSEHTGSEPAGTVDSPESAFNRRWIDELLERTCDEVRERLVARGHSMHWDILRNRILKPCLTGADPVPHEELARKWGLRGLPQVATLLVSAKRLFATTLLENVRATLPPGSSPNAELHELLRTLGAGR